MSMSDFLKAKFEYLLLAFFMMFLALVIVHILHRGGDTAKAFDWLSNSYSALQGALLGLITGRQLAVRSQDNKNGNGSGGIPPAK